MNQDEIIKDYLEENREITSWEAFEMFGITRLSAVIFRLRKSGLNISSNSTTKTNRYGHKVTFSTYRLEME